jgi:hypothetical protein
MDSPLTVAIRQFEATEANLAKAERLVTGASREDQIVSKRSKLGEQ